MVNKMEGEATVSFAAATVEQIQAILDIFGVVFEFFISKMSILLQWFIGNPIGLISLAVITISAIVLLFRSLIRL